MTKTKKKRSPNGKDAPTVDDILDTDPAVAPPATGRPIDERADAVRRRDECEQAVAEALQRHHCTIVPQLFLEPVGAEGSKAIVSAQWKLLPLQVRE